MVNKGDRITTAVWADLAAKANAKTSLRGKPYIFSSSFYVFETTDHMLSCSRMDSGEYAHGNTGIIKDINKAYKYKGFGDTRLISEYDELPSGSMYVGDSLPTGNDNFNLAFLKGVNVIYRWDKRTDQWLTFGDFVTGHTTNGWLTELKRLRNDINHIIFYPNYHASTTGVKDYYSLNTLGYCVYVTGSDGEIYFTPQQLITASVFTDTRYPFEPITSGWTTYDGFSHPMQWQNNTMPIYEFADISYIYPQPQAPSVETIIRFFADAEQGTDRNNYFNSNHGVKYRVKTNISGSNYPILDAMVFIPFETFNVANLPYTGSTPSYTLDTNITPTDIIFFGGPTGSITGDRYIGVNLYYSQSVFDVQQWDLSFEMGGATTLANGSHMKDYLNTYNGRPSLRWISNASTAVNHIHATKEIGEIYLPKGVTSNGDTDVLKIYTYYFSHYRYGPYYYWATTTNPLVQAVSGSYGFFMARSRPLIGLNCDPVFEVPWVGERSIISRYARGPYSELPDLVAYPITSSEMHYSQMVDNNIPSIPVYQYPSTGKIGQDITGKYLPSGSMVWRCRINRVNQITSSTFVEPISQYHSQSATPMPYDVGFIRNGSYVSLASGSIPSGSNQVTLYPEWVIFDATALTYKNISGSYRVDANICVKNQTICGVGYGSNPVTPFLVDVRNGIYAMHLNDTERLLDAVT